MNAKTGAVDITVVILTFNEERHILRAINSVMNIAKEIIVIDSYSTDKTVEISKNAGARVLQHAFVNHSKQFQWGLDEGGIKSQWIMRLDADEVIEADLVKSIQSILPDLPANIVGVNFDRKHIFMGRWVRYGGRYPLRLLRLWRRGNGRVEDRWMDEHIVIWGGTTINMVGGFSDVNENDLSFFTDKHNKYATREALDVLTERYNLKAEDSGFNVNSVSKQTAVKRFLKENLYNKLPFWLGPLAYFFYRYIFQLGFLDGRTGLIYHFLQGFWYRFLVGAKILEFERAISHCMDDDQRRSELERITGLPLFK